jgi:hypothetical protein
MIVKATALMDYVLKMLVRMALGVLVNISPDHSAVPERHGTQYLSSGV